MGQALYRKYRSRSLDEVVGQEHITDTLAHALKSGRISHAYLFTGPRGVGKTSIARIWAHEINGLPYTNNSTHLDIIEIDAASNRRIDEIRELRDKVNVAPTSATYKVYIIDEVHMLTREAFNALLKTLEEPPAHAVFILATTEVHKLPETIISRTQRFTFKPVEMTKVVAHLRSIAEQEKVGITDEALALIAAHGEGSFRDSISLLDQASGTEGSIDINTIQQLLGIPPAEMLEALQSALANHDGVALVTTLTQLREQGYQPTQISKQLGEAWRQKILANGAGEPTDFAFLEKLLSVASAHNPERYLEITLLEFALSKPTAAVATTPSQPPTPQLPPKPAIKEVTAATPKPKTEQTPAPETLTPKTPRPAPQAEAEINTETEAAAKSATKVSAVLDEALWPKVLDALKKKYNTLYGIIRMAQPVFREDELELKFGFAFHRKRVAEAKNQQILLDIIQNLTGNTITITCVLIEKKPEGEPAAVELAASTPLNAPAESAVQPNISAISNIFGGGELLES